MDVARVLAAPKATAMETIGMVVTPDPVVVDLDLPNVEPNPEEVQWVDDIHSPSGG